jgi:hypothetical protein
VITGAVVSAIIVISAIAGAVAPKKSGPNAADNPAPAFQAPSSERLPNPNHKTPHKAERHVHRASPTTVQLLAASSNIRAGGTVKISGSVSPGLAGHVVYLQRRVAPYVWVSVQHQRLSDRSSFHFAVSGTRAGAFVYRVRQPRVLHQFQAGVSQVVHIRVHAVVHHVAPQPAAPKQQCTPGYSPCVPVAYDVDCAGGSGDGPAYVEGPIYVTGSDPYGLDSDGDGVACES